MVANNYTENIKWGWMGLNDATWRIFPEIDEKMLTSAKYHMKDVQTHTIWKQQHNSFPMRVIHPNWTSGSKIRAI